MIGLNSFNQVFDVEIDRKSKPMRPLPAGKVSVKFVYVFSLLSFLASLLISLMASAYFSLIVLFFIVLSVSYSCPPIRLKRYGISSNIIGGTLYGAIPFLSVWVTSNSSFPLVFFILFYGLAVSIATLKDFEDAGVEKDFGIRTLPVLLGYRKAKYIVLTMILSLLILMLISSVSIIDNRFVYPTLFSIFLALTIARMDFYKKENVISQSKNVTTGMIIIILIEVSYAVTALFINLA